MSRAHPSLSRRGFLTTAGAATAVSLLAPAPAAGAVPAPAEAVPGTGTHVITLGTSAGPAVPGPRKGIATAVVVDGHLYLVDAGLGVQRQLREGKLPVDRLRAVLVTHLHSDHVAELPAVLLYNWGPPVQGFTHPFSVVGPGRAGALPHGARPAVAPATPGTEDLVRNLLAAYAYDINIRVHDEARPPLDELVRARDIRLPADVDAGPRGELAPDMEPFEIYRDENVRVLATLVAHPPVFPSFGFRIETRHGVTVAISGDTTRHDNVVRLAEGADMLVHEAVNLDYFRQGNYSEEFLKHQAESHTEPADAGRVAAAAGVDHLVLSHLAGVATPAEWGGPAQATFGGRVTVAADGQVFSLST